MAQGHLSLLYGYYIERKNVQDVLDDLTEGIIVHDRARRILFFNRAAEEITGFSRLDVLGKDCHEAFGGPFCGGRCSFQGEPPRSLDHLYYPLNILTRNGEPRRIEMAVSGRQEADGNLSGVIASFRDVSDLIGLKMQAGELNEFAGIVGGNPKMLEIYSQIGDLAVNDYPVHITGETGTGKELVAVAVHNESRRGGGPFVPVNCAALPEGMLESELFGHVKGAFTGAVRDKKGRFELADGGTLFLDEVAELPMNVQAKLLRVLQEGTFDRVGGEKPVSADVRLISATNHDLKQETDAGRFRKDLYYRVNVVPIHLPPLRERGGDIDLLLSYFLDEARAEGQASSGLSREALSVMKRYGWPGNVRELQSAVRFALVRSRGRVIRPAHLPLELREFGKRKGTRGPAPKLDDESVKTALEKTGGNKAKAARILGVGRATLYRHLKDASSVS
ncbi:MAG: sigma 54-interacting transcriptional regulator [Deltaproteobacteria bacterium]|nr:sigma 54-interacting transcriptional regulator [Deltaproteobacteria bacterium]